LLLDLWGFGQVAAQIFVLAHVCSHSILRVGSLVSIVVIIVIIGALLFYFTVVVGLQYLVGII
jgi:hypothetical protein